MEKIRQKILKNPVSYAVTTFPRPRKSVFMDQNKFFGFINKHHPFWLQLVYTLLNHHFSTFLNSIIELRITDEGSVPEMRIWSILLFKSN